MIQYACFASLKKQYFVLKKYLERRCSQIDEIIQIHYNMLIIMEICFENLLKSGFFIKI